MGCSSSKPVAEETTAVEAVVPSATSLPPPPSSNNTKLASQVRKVSFENSPDVVAAAVAAAATTTTTPDDGNSKQKHDSVVDDEEDPFASDVHPSRKKGNAPTTTSTNSNSNNVVVVKSIMEDSWEFLHRVTKDKLLDASDVKSVESGKMEIASIRQYAHQLLEQLQELTNLGQSAVLLGSNAMMGMDDSGGLMGGMHNKQAGGYSYHHQSHGMGGGIMEIDDDDEEEKEDYTEHKDSNRKALYDKQDFSKFKKEKSWKSEETRKMIHDVIQKNELFEHYSEEEMLEIIDVFKPESFKEGEVVIRQGDTGDHFYLVESGRLNIHINVGKEGDESKVIIGTYGKGDAFGELALILGHPRNSTVTATTDCKLWSLERQTYRCVISQLRYNQHEEKMTFFRTCEIKGRMFTNIFDGAQIEDLAIAAKADAFDEGSVIIREGEPSEVFYFLRSGEVNAYNKKGGTSMMAYDDGLDNLAFTIMEKRAFGTTSLMKGSVSPYTYVAKSPVRVYYITKDSFELMLGSLQSALDGNTISRSVTREKSKRSFKDRDAATMIADRVHDHLQLKDLKFYNTLGRGAFGRVTLVQSKQDKALFALKSQVKDYIVKKGQQEHVLNEYRIMKTVGHDPHILGLHNVMQDERHLYFLIDLLPGGQLMTYVRHYRRFTESMSRFYAASVILAFERLHTDLIAYRDLKPENIVLDKDGYSVLVDFGLAKQIEEGQTYTFCGTPDYITPEMLRMTGHDYGVDYWGLGIFLYETVYGKAPFYATSNARRYKKILKGIDYVIVPSQFSEALTDLIRHLLVDDQSKRLGRTKSGIQGIKSHRFFAGFDWEGLEQKRITPPIKPLIPQDLKTLGKPFVSPIDDITVPKCSWNPDLKTLEGWL